MQSLLYRLLLNDKEVVGFNISMNNPTPVRCLEDSEDVDCIIHYHAFLHFPVVDFVLVHNILSNKSRQAIVREMMSEPELFVINYNITTISVRG